MKLCIFIGMNVGGMVGWWLGEHIGMMTAFAISSLGTILGVYGGWRVARTYLG